MKELKEKYGLVTATATVIGSVIGSGVFYKAETVCKVTAGDGRLGAAAWIIGGTVMLLCLLSFAFIASKIGGEGGLCGIAEKTAGPSFSYYVGWFMAAVYYPSLVSVLSWLSAVYTLTLFQVADSSGGLCMTLSSVYMIIIFSQNVLFSDYSGKFQSVTAGIKLIPLLLMIGLGTVKGVTGGNFEQSFFVSTKASSSGIFGAVAAVMFAYEGWIAVTGIGAEIKNSRRNLPLALIIGGVTVSVIYVLYYVGIMGAVKPEILLNYGKDGIKIAYESVAGRAAGGLLTGFVAVSCIGALNGMMMCCGRAMYSLSVTGRGPAKSTFSQVLPKSGMPAASFVAGLTFSMLWLFFLFGSGISEKPLFADFGFDISELPVITAYALYIPIFFAFVKKSLKGKSIGGVVIPSLGIAASVFVICCGVAAHGRDIIDYLFIFVPIMLVGGLFR